jgi:hypothetical protein
MTYLADVELKTYWILEDAIVWVQQHEPTASANGFHLALTGGCLYRGWSYKDADVIVYCHANEKPKIVFKDLIPLLGLTVVKRPKTKGASDYREVWICKDSKDRRIDLFPHERV